MKTMPDATALDFTYQGNPADIVFGAGTRRTVGEWVERLGCRRALVLVTPRRAKEAAELASHLGERAAGVFAGAAMHTPVDVTERALAKVRTTDADCLLSFGGGSTTGLAKAIAWRTDLPQIAIPTTYAGSEATGILGQTQDGKKTTIRDPKLRPKVIVYDPDLTLDLPVASSVASALNAMSHALEGLYAPDRSPLSNLMAQEGLRVMKAALPRVVAEPGNREARAGALYGAWLCGTVLEAVSMALHHKICHTLGGTFDTPHAETHAVMLPHTIAFNEAAAPDLLTSAAEIFGRPVSAGLWAFARTLGAPHALRDFGLCEQNLDQAATLAGMNPYRNPRPIERSAIRALLQDAWEGRPPRS